MKISLNIDPTRTETEIVIYSRGLTPETESILAALHMMDSRLTVTRDDETFLLDIAEIMYIESVDRRTFVYTATACYESKLKLYEMENRLCNLGFLRTSKSCLVRLKHIRSLRAEFDRRLRLTLENDEQIIVSRQYAEEIKGRLGVK